MGCCPSKRRAAQQAAEDENEEQERGRSDTTIGEEYINPLRSKQSNAHLGSTETNPTFHLAGPGGGGGDDGISTDDPRVVLTGSAGVGGEGGDGKGIENGGGSAKTASGEPTNRISSRVTKLSAASVGMRVHVNGQESIGTLRFYGNHKETGKTRCGVEFDAEVERGRSGTFKGHEYFQCPPKRGLLCIPSKVTLIQEETTESAGAVVTNLALLDDGEVGAAVAFHANDNGREEVDSMIGKIKAQMSEFDAANAAIDANGGTPPPGSDLATVASEESCDAIGALFTIEKSLQLQLEELVARGGTEGAKAHAADLAAVRKDLADTSGTLRAAVASYLDSWKGAVPDLSSLPTEPEAFAKLPIANKPGKVTMQRVIGALVLDAEAKRDPAGLDGGARQGIWDHGEITEEEAEARLGKAGFEDGNFLARSHLGSYVLVIVFKGNIAKNWVQRDRTTGMLTIYDKSYGDAKTLPHLIAALQTKPEGYLINLDRPLPYPESAVGFGIAPDLLNPLLEAYGKQRTKESVSLVRVVRADMDAYSAAAAKHVALAGPDVMKRLDAAAEPKASKSMSFSAEKLAEMTHDSKAPAPTSLSYVAHAQRVAADVSIAVYVVICLMITAIGVGGYCIPGNVKQSRRIIFKTLFKYGGLFLKCRDLSRVTIKVPNLTVMVQLAEALHKHPQLKVWRCKNRFSAKERGNAQDSGGYLDFQMVCLFKLHGRYHYVEVQLNLIEMVAIKAGISSAGGGGGGGHDAFNTARVIDAFSRRSTEYRGNPSAELWAMIAAGSVQRVILDGATITGDDAEQLEKAMESSQCRVETLSLKGFKPDVAVLTGFLLPIWLKNAEESSVADLSRCKELTTVPEGLSELVNLQALNLKECTNLTTLPEGLGELVNLQSLNLKHCKKLTTLPEGMSKLAKLQSLDLGGCSKLTMLPEGLSKLVNLQSLSMWGCSKLTTLPEGLSKLVNLQSVNLHECWGLTMVPDLSHLLPKLKIENVPKHLSAWEKQGFVAFDLTNVSNLDYSHFEGTELPEWLSKLVNLQSLNLSSCYELTTLPEGLGELVKLQSLDLERCYELTMLPEGMSKLVKLQSLNLSKCKNLTMLPEGLSELVNLQSLDLRFCEKLTTLPEVVSKLVNLQSLKLIYCSNLTTLSEGLSELVNLQSLDLAYCKNLTMLPEGMSELVNLQSLNLYECRKLTMLPEGLSKLVNLQSLYLRGCKNLTTLPEGLSKLVNLQSLDLSGCSNLRTLPEGLSKLVNLQSLNLSECKNLIMLPEGWGELVNLQSLNLDRCSNLMMLPEGLGELVNLQSLNLDRCSKLKMLPEGLSKLVNLQSLNLRECRNLTTLSEGLGELVNLQSLDLRRCRNLTTLPEGLSKLANLQSLDLEACLSLAEPLPDLSHLLSALKIYRVIYASHAAQAWKKRGFTAAP